MIKRRIGGFVLGAAAGFLLAGCGDDDDRTVVEFMHSSVEQDRLAVINELVAKFEEENPSVKVEQVATEEDSYNTRVITLAMSGQLPAVIEVSQDYAKVMDRDELIDKPAVNGLLNDLGAENYYDGALDVFRTEDGESVTGIPMSGWVQGIWYNKEMLAEEGFEEPETWEDVLEVAETFTDESENKYGIGLPTVDGLFAEQSFSQFALSNNANVLSEHGDLTLNTPEMQKALEFYQSLSAYTMPGSNDTTEIRDAFTNGTVPMAIYSTYLLPSIYEEGEADNIGFAVPTKESRAVYGSVSSLTISSGLEEEKKEAAEAFVSFMAQPENTAEWILMSPGGAQPVHEYVVEEESYSEHEVVKAFGGLSEELAESFNDVQIFGLVDGKNFLKMGDISSSGVIASMVNGVTVGQREVNQEIENAEATIQEAISED
ncbi:ABC transporter substrate-binding protein [Shouchella shacheensis]|uniref:ABC transporter substrate-binding protein n=1 Tax=Shouchella shacheensis TaxID=1649580 RepID=UPI00073FD9A1|nr:sugar ABC transporter substrate-binding protein [Shouchella shacheensis]